MRKSNSHHQSGTIHVVQLYVRVVLPFARVAVPVRSVCQADKRKPRTTQCREERQPVENTCGKKVYDIIYYFYFAL